MTLDDLELQLIVNIDRVKYEICRNRELFLNNQISVASYNERDIYLKGYKDALDIIFDKFKDKQL